MTATATEQPQQTITATSSATTSTSTNTSISSEDHVQHIIRKGFFEEAPIRVGTGLVIGGLASLVLVSKGQNANAAGRKMMTFLGGGIGLGSAWTKTSMELEQTLKSK